MLNILVSMAIFPTVFVHDLARLTLDLALLTLDLALLTLDLALFQVNSTTVDFFYCVAR